MFYFFFPFPTKYPARRLGRTKIAISGPVFASFFGVGVTEPDDELPELEELPDDVDLFVVVVVFVVSFVTPLLSAGGGGVVVFVLLDELPPSDGGASLEPESELPESPNGDETLGGASAYDTATVVTREIISADSISCSFFIGFGYFSDLVNCMVKY